jgi:hypothetical protein
MRGTQRPVLRGLDDFRVRVQEPLRGLFYGCCFTFARRTRKYFGTCCPSIAVTGCLQILQWINR